MHLGQDYTMEANVDDPTVSIHRLSRSQSFLPNPDFRRHALALSTVSCIIADSYDVGGRCDDRAKNDDDDDYHSVSSSQSQFQRPLSLAA